MKGFVKVGRVEDFSDGRGRAVRVGERKVAVFRVGKRWHAMRDDCPHMGASLADGKLDGGCVVCHWHGWKFDLTTGRTDERSWACAEIYRVRIEGNEVWLEPPPAPPPAPPQDDDDWIAWDPDKFFKKKG